MLAVINAILWVLAFLILLGICKKVKVSYLEVGLRLLYVDPIINCDFVTQVNSSPQIALTHVALKVTCQSS